MNPVAIAECTARAREAYAKQPQYREYMYVMRGVEAMQAGCYGWRLVKHQVWTPPDRVLVYRDIQAQT